MEDNEYRIWFSKLDISNKNKLKLLSDFEKCENIWNASKSDFELRDYKEIVISKILDEKLKLNLEKENRILTKEKIIILMNYDSCYPKKLLNIDDCPSQIYVKGNIKKLNNYNIGIVGSRNASDYGKIISRKIAKEISSLNINVLSGLAIGIDKMAHLGALENGRGNTIAVLGCGLCENVFYPYENLKVYQRIIEEGGIVVSEYSYFEKAIAYHFPQRNRIISGLSDKLVVVEASEKSGSLITVEYALEQGKDIYAVPGNVGNYSSNGTNKLIQDGAYPLLKIDDLFI